MRFRLTTHVLSGCLCLAAVAIAQGSEAGQVDAKPDSPTPKLEETPAGGLAMSAAVACRSIDGYERYELLPLATLTADEKLLVYYRPLNYHVEKTGISHRVHLIQDGQIRRRGEKAVLLRKEKLLEFDFKVDSQPEQIYLKNTVSLKGLKPGEYEYDVILHDQIAKSEAAKQSMVFRVVAAALPKEDGEAGADAAKEVGETDSAKERPRSSQGRSRLRKSSRTRPGRSPAQR